MSFMKIIKSNLAPVLGKKWKSTIMLNSITGKSIVISVTDKDVVYLNYHNKISIIDVYPNASTIVKKSATKKIGGGLLGAAIGGVAGAVIGTVAVGNNKVDNTPQSMTIKYSYIEDGLEVFTQQVVDYSKEKFIKLQELI